MAKNWMERLIQEDQKLEPKQSEPLPLRGDLKRKAVAKIDAAVHAKTAMASLTAERTNGHQV